MPKSFSGALLQPDVLFVSRLTKNTCCSCFIPQAHCVCSLLEMWPLATLCAKVQFSVFSGLWKYFQYLSMKGTDRSPLASRLHVPCISLLWYPHCLPLSALSLPSLPSYFWSALKCFCTGNLEIPSLTAEIMCYRGTMVMSAPWTLNNDLWKGKSVGEWQKVMMGDCEHRDRALPACERRNLFLQLHRV